MEFYVKYLDLLMKELTYPAETLNTRVEVDFSDEITVAIFGFSDTVCKLVEQLSSFINKVHLTSDAETIFNLTLEDLIQDYNNFYCQESDDIANTTRDNILQQGVYSVPECIELLEKF